VRRYASELLNALVRVRPNDEFVVFGSSEGAAVPATVQRRPATRVVPTNLGWCLVDLPRAVRRERLDVFHSPAYTAPLYGVHPLALTIHDVSYERHPKWYPYRRDPLRRWFYRQSARTADLIITDSAFSRREISAAYGVDADHIKVVPLGVGAPFVGSARHLLPQGVTAPYVLHVGDLHPRRNLLTLIRALGRLRSLPERPDAPMLVLAGVDRGERARLEVEARRASVEIHFAGATDDGTLASLYAGAAVFAYPSRYEGFGLPLLEAMACGAPVLGARAGSIPEVVGDAGILVDPDDENGMAAQIGRLVDDADLANRLRESGRQRAKEFTWDRTAMLTVDAYRAAVDR
jgi:glycosyltransferase involved in cell wall biosynthesis